MAEKDEERAPRRPNDTRGANDYSNLAPGNPYNYGYGSRRGRLGSYGEGDQYYRKGYWHITGPYSEREEWRRPGPHTGQGPRGLEGSDEKIHEEVCDRLTRHGWIDASNIEVSVEDNQVWLRGTVRDRRMKRMAEDTAETVAGVVDVHNRLTIERVDSEELPL